MLLDSIRSQITESVKSKNSERAETLRFLLASIQNQAIAKYGSTWSTSVNDEDVLDVIRKQVKSHKESVSAFETAGRNELVEKEKKQLEILEAYLPKGLSDQELADLLKPVVATGEKNFGLLMGVAMAKLKGQADGAKVSMVLKELLNKE